MTRTRRRKPRKAPLTVYAAIRRDVRAAIEERVLDRIINDTTPPPPIGADL